MRAYSGGRWVVSLVVAAGVLVGVCPATPRSEAQPSSTGAICVRRETLLPVDDGSRPMPRGLYFFHIDDLPPIEVRPDKGTLLSGLDVAKSHIVRLYRGGKAVASVRIRVTSAQPQCVGLANYADDITACSSKCSK